MTGLEQRVTAMEDHLNTVQDQDQELLYLRSKLIDLKERSHRDNVRFFGFPEHIKGTSPGTQKTGRSIRSQPTIACLLRHTRVRQLLTEACSHGPFRHEYYKIRISADFSKETNECCKAFLSLRPCLCQLEVKYGLYGPAHMWLTKKGQSKGFYDMEDMHLFLDGLMATAMDLNPSILPSELLEDPLGTQSSYTPEDGCNSGDGMSRHRGRDLERLSRPQSDRNQTLLAVAQHIQPPDRDKTCTPLKPMTLPN
ncbi:hypothetical protein NDU88_003256 [Pleurodeles waltl]|uniref:Uncharacterized protein n=1 Tax=Pleurodeles waltl TaxID=8319 RepID=A0AAV7WT45_PLEWA|nr:hypothetical protein NDU88_003256 [Pleurodeles waltl]